MNHSMSRPRAMSLIRKPASSRCRQSSLPPFGSSASPTQFIPRQTPVVFGTSKLAKSLNTNSLKQVCPKIQQPIVPTRKYTVRIISNWGDPEMVSCGEIVPIDITRKQIPVVSINAIPREAAFEDLNRLVDSSIYRSNQYWKSQFPLRKPIEITIAVPSINKPIIFRVLNVQNAKSGIREMEIYEEEVQVWKGEIPIDLAFVCRLQSFDDDDQNQGDDDDPTSLNKKKQKRQSTLISSVRSESYIKKFDPLVDDFGAIPQIPTNYIIVEFLSNYGNGPTFGLSGIELLTTKKEVVKSDNIDNCNVLYGTCPIDPSTLFRGHYYDPQMEEMWVFDRINQEKNPQLIVTFKKPIIVGAIKFWNFFPCDAGEVVSGPSFSKHISVKHVLIRFDNNSTIFEGKLRQGDGTIKNLNGSLTTIYLNDMDYKVMRSKQANNHPSSIPLPLNTNC